MPDPSERVADDKIARGTRRASRTGGLAACRGFTLMELMIAIALVAAIATGMLMAMRGGLLTLNRTEARLEENRRAMGIQRILSLQLAGAVPVRSGCNGGTFSPFAFRGSISALQMVSTYSITEGSRGYPHVVEYQVAPDENGTFKLIIHERPYSGAGTMSEFCSENISLRGSAQPFVAATRLAYCRFFYHQVNPDTQFRGLDWVNNWNDPDLPSAVRIELLPAAPDATRLPVLSVTASLPANRFFQDLPYEDQQ